MVKIAFIGCGFVADYYIRTLANYPQLELSGVYDKDLGRAKAFSSYHSVRYYSTLNQLLNDSSDIIVNLTNPKAHFAVSKACLEAGKHVYSEKPLTLSFQDSRKLVNLARKKKLQISCAPCSILGESAQTMWSALRKNEIGKVRLAYAEMDYPLVHLNYKNWRSKSRAFFPYNDEFKIGHTLVHSGYYLTWLCAFFGSAKCVTTFKLRKKILDFSVACIEFKSDIVARLTCSNISPSNRNLLIIGEKGYLSTHDCWNYNSPVFLKTPGFEGKSVIKNDKKYRFTGRYKLPNYYKCPPEMDFSKGIAELADAIKEERQSILNSDFSLHVNEIMLAIHNSDKNNKHHRIRTAFKPIAPVQG